MGRGWGLAGNRMQAHPSFGFNSIGTLWRSCFFGGMTGNGRDLSALCLFGAELGALLIGSFDMWDSERTPG